MGSANSKKPEISIRAIRSSTEDIRSSLRRKQVPLQNKEELHQTLINNSKQLNTLRSKGPKKKQLEIDQIQKLVRDVNEELLEYNDDQLDKGADESHSFIHVNPARIKSQKITPKVSKGRSNSRGIFPVIKLNEIEHQFSKVKNDVIVGIKNRDNQTLLLQKNKIEMLQTDLELLNITQSSTLFEKKENLERELYRYYQKIIRTEKNQAKLNKVVSDGDIDEIKKNFSKLHSLEIMIQDIQDVLQNIVLGDNRGNIKDYTEELKKIELQLDEIKDGNRDNLKQKTILIKNVNSTKKLLDEVEKKIEMDALNRIMREIDNIKAEASDKNKNDKMKPMNDIKRLQKELEHCQVNHDENKTFKSEYLRDLNSFLEKLDPNHDGVIMRTKKLKSSNSVEDLLNLQKEWKNLEKNLSTTKPEEVRRVDVLLENFETSIKAKRRSLAELMKKTNFESGQRRSDELIRTSAKIFDLAEVQTTKPTKKLSREQVTPSKKYGTIEYTLQEITKISDRVEELGKNILAFEGTSEDLEYNFFRASLIDKKQILQNLAHRSSWNQVDVFKLEILEKIGFYEEYLKYKLNQNILEMKLNKKLVDIESKIKKFSGSYQNIQFRSIDNELSDCLKEAELIDIVDKTENFKQKINFLKTMLKEKSYSDVTLNHVENSTDTKKIITENKEYIQKIKEKIENTQDLNMSNSFVIQDCLRSKTLELMNLNLKNDTPMFDEVRKSLSEIEICKNLIKEKIKKQEQRETFEDIENKLSNLQHDISDFDGLATDKTYSYLNESLNELEAKLCRIPETEHTQGKNLELSLQINFSKNRLREVAEDSENILVVENRIKELLQIFSEGKPDIDFNSLDEEFIKLRIDLDKLGITERLSYRKLTCVSYIEYLMKQMSERNKAKIGHVSRSVIV